MEDDPRYKAHKASQLLRQHKMAAPWFFDHLDMFSDSTKLVLVPPTIKTLLDEKSPYYGCWNVAYWLGSEK